jgi:hypothetical protein
MSEVCEICARKKDDGKGSDDTCEREYLGLGTDDSRCYRLGYERTLARADRYEAEFAACKALLIAAEGRAEEAERRAREWKETADKYTLKWDAELVRRAAAEQRASEVRALLREAADYVWGLARNGSREAGELVARIDAATGGASTHDDWRHRPCDNCGHERRAHLWRDGSTHCGACGLTACPSFVALAALPVEPARPDQKEIQRDGDTPSAPVRCHHRDCGGGPHKSHMSSHPSPTGDT